VNGCSVSLGLAPTKVLAKVASNYSKPSGLVEISGKSAKKFLVSMQRFRTFYPPTSNRDILYAKVSHNLEEVCRRCRRSDLVASEVVVVLKSVQFKNSGFKTKLPLLTACPSIILRSIRPHFLKFLRGSAERAVGERYRSTGVVLAHLKERASVQLLLFDSPQNMQREEAIFEALDTLNDKFGGEVGFLASSLHYGKYAGKKELKKIKNFTSKSRTRHEYLLS